jgi:hypothetical protein
MPQRQTAKTFHLNTVIGDRLITAVVSFSPAPPEGVLTEIARLDAERLLAACVSEDIVGGRL